MVLGRRLVTDEVTCNPQGYGECLLFSYSLPLWSAPLVLAMLSFNLCLNYSLPRTHGDTSHVLWASLALRAIPTIALQK